MAAIPAYGHLYPLMPLALACAAAGHEVTIASGPPFLGRLPLPTVRQQPDALGLGAAIDETRRRYPGLAGHDLSVGLFADVTAEAVSDSLVEVFEQHRPDLLLYEGLDAGAGLAADLLGIPAVAVAIGLDHTMYATIHGAVIGYHHARWTARGRRPPAGAPLLAGALLDPTPPSLARFNGLVPVRKIAIRPVAWVESIGGVPGWLDEVANRPRIYLTLGTVAYGAVAVLQRVLAAVNDLDVDVLVAAGPDADPTALGEVGARVHLATFVDQSAVLSRVDLIVHHGGTGTVLGALAAGLPQLILPQAADQFFNAETLTEAGAARVLLNREQDRRTIRDAVVALLADGNPERAVARRLRAEIAEMPAPADVIPALAETVAG